MLNDMKIESKYLSYYEAALERKYGLNISTENQPFECDDLLKMLDDMYSSFPKGLIKEITSYYRARGTKTNVKFIFKETQVSGSFVLCNNEITLYYYPNTKDKFGEWVIGHEMGHYVHKYLNDRYGYHKLKQQWTSLNDSFCYGKINWTTKHQDYFVREYSLTNYSEDFATVVELLTQNSANGFKSRIVNKSCALKKKVDLILNVLLQKSYSFQNLKRIKDKDYSMLRMAME